MPGRKIPLVTNQIYHLLNRGVASQPIFLSKWDYKRARETMLYYQNREASMSYSVFLKLSQEKREKIFRELRKKGIFG